MLHVRIEKYVVHRVMICVYMVYILYFVPCTLETVLLDMVSHQSLTIYP